MATSPTTPAPPVNRLAGPVREVMRPGVITMAEDASLLQAKRAMVRHGVHAVLVCGPRPLGWVTDSGLLRWLERDLSAIPASHAITEPPHYIDAGARSARRARGARRPGRLPRARRPQPRRSPAGRRGAPGPRRPPLPPMSTEQIT